MPTASLSHLFTADHRACDGLFADAEAAARADNWTACAEAAAAFRGAMERHFRVEEEVLFPAFEAAGPGPVGPTQVMRHEHAQMRGLLEQWQGHADARRRAPFLAVCETLLVFMQQHNLKEENVLYPMCDAVLRPRAAELAATVGEVLHPQ